MISYFVDSVCRLPSFLISPSESVWFSVKGGAPNYYPNSFGAPEQQPSALEHRTHCSGDVQRFNSANDDNVTQVMAPLSAVRAGCLFSLSMSAYIPPFKVSNMSYIEFRDNISIHKSVPVLNGVEALCYCALLVQGMETHFSSSKFY